MAFTLQQLKSMSWLDRDAAIKDLKKAGIKPVGDDYELRQHGISSWQLMERNEDVSQIPEPRKTAGKATQKAAQKPAAKPAAKPSAPAIDLFPEPANPAAEELKTMIDPAPSNQQPCSLVIRDGFSQAGSVTAALDYSKRLGKVVHVVNCHGETIRSVDAARVKVLQAQLKQPSKANGSDRQPSSAGKSAEVAALLFRKRGATYDELVAVTEWAFGESYIHRTARTHRAEVKSLGNKHWRLIKP